MIIDSHVHVWSRTTDPRRDSMEWLPAAARDRRSAATLDQVDAEMTQAQVTGVVLVQAANELAHTDELLAAAAASARPAKVVGWLPLADPGETTLALQRYADRAALTGVRHRQGDSDDPGFLVRPDVTQSLELIAEAGLSLDIMPWPPGVLEQIPVIARRHPRMPIVIDMLGWPRIAERRMQPWTDQLAAAAAEPTVYVKLGGLYRLAGERNEPEHWRPYVQTAVQLFGPDRMMIGSNWPTMTAFGHRYCEFIQAVLASLDDLIDAEQAEVRSGTAVRLYGF